MNDSYGVRSFPLSLLSLIRSLFHFFFLCNNKWWATSNHPHVIRRAFNAVEQHVTH